MRYILTSLVSHRQRVLEASELTMLLRLALKHGWQPTPTRVQQGQLQLEDAFEAAEARALADALEYALRATGALPPPTIIVVLETIGVLRFGGARLVRG